jgi:tetratricopeptide (TPR) repeat protein
VAGVNPRESSDANDVDVRVARLIPRLDALRRRIAHRFDARARAEFDRLRREVVALHESGNDRDAEAAARRLVELQRLALGETHLDYATSLGNLALLLQRRGAHESAEPLLRQALEIRRAALGELHPHTATALHNLALLLCERGAHESAEPLLRRALEIRRDVLGEQHPDYATSLGGLALLLQRRGAHESAEPLLRQALEIRRDVLGEHHPHYATALSNLALLLCERGAHPAAGPLLRQALEIHRATLGEQHPETRASRDSLARLLATHEGPGTSPGPEPARAPCPEARSIRDELRGWIATYADIAAAMRRTSVLMETGGYPPGDRLVRGVADCAAAFARLRPAAIRLAEAAGVFPSTPEDVLSLPGLIALLDAVVEAEDQARDLRP